ncbi:hypothetical protein BGW36DRAFT_153235 [Talaromyces proteolyticus]|uniref:Uncharacterized protein n=1 Tax=Talaromyces proteolyticus TaxID=1131652 RepID=A0AAD4KYQ4_9EURO|nr:uncharacterized protein BGW36DRAFT_153235 [Talaromyces proteolyticus]KAH8698976.1 hypothetical protein BGW36DRAFT_153235 [Talaromyces proteolyticus]
MCFPRHLRRGHHTLRIPVSALPCNSRRSYHRLGTAYLTEYQQRRYSAFRCAQVGFAQPCLRDQLMICWLSLLSIVAIFQYHYLAENNIIAICVIIARLCHQLQQLPVLLADSLYLLPSFQQHSLAAPPYPQPSYFVTVIFVLHPLYAAWLCRLESFFAFKKYDNTTHEIIDS